MKMLLLPGGYEHTATTPLLLHQFLYSDLHTFSNYLLHFFFLKADA